MITQSLQRGLWPVSGLLLMMLVSGCARQDEPIFESVDYNVIFISIDTLRADHLGAYGYEKETSPNIDAFAADTVLFQSAIAHAPSTLPSHGSLFTGMIPINHGAFASLQSSISEDLMTLPEVMQQAGFRTISYNGGGLVAGIYGFDRGFEDYVTDARNDYFREKVASALEWLDTNPSEKFFMFLHTYEVHDPYAPQEDLLALFEKDYEGPLSNDIGPREIADINANRDELTPADIEHVRNTYNAEIRSMDLAFGELVQGLQARGLYDNTIIVLTSDHGEEFNEHGVIGRHFFTLYDELLHVPLLVKLPESMLAGTVVREQVRGIDVMPTILDLVAINVPFGFDGKSLVPEMFGESDAELVAISQQDTSDVLPPTSVRTESKKLIIRPDYFDDPAVESVWVKDRFEFSTSSTFVTVALASADAERSLRVTANGVQVMKQRISSERQHLFITLIPSGQPGVADDSNGRAIIANRYAEQKVVVESVEPCVLLSAIADTDGPSCVSFQVFDPQEFYRLDEDSAELSNLYRDPGADSDIAEMRTYLEKELARKPKASGTKLEIDAETRRQLKDLGYLN